MYKIVYTLQVRGVGMCGLYRLFGPSKSDDEEDKENHKTEEASEEQEEDAVILFLLNVWQGFRLHKD